MKNQHAVALGKLSAGVPRACSPDRADALRGRLKDARAKRWVYCPECGRKHSYKRLCQPAEVE